MLASIKIEINTELTLLINVMINAGQRSLIRKKKTMFAADSLEKRVDI